MAYVHSTHVVQGCCMYALRHECIALDSIEHARTYFNTAGARIDDVGLANLYGV
jgi:hypothetical protein